MTGNLVLVSSYPKSGNTWTRAVLEQLQRGPQWQFSINEMSSGFYGPSHRLLFDAFSPANASDLFTAEIHAMLPEVYRALSREINALKILKVHDAYRKVSTGELLYPEDAVRAVIYLVRHPFDVAVSLGPHLNLSLPEAVDLMRDGATSAQSSTGLDLPLPQEIHPWSVNVTSWLNDSPHKVTLVRYEDLCADPPAQFMRIARAAGFDPTEDDIARCLETSSFENMKKQETETGFRERPKTSSVFFREGKPGGWKDKLDETLRQRIVNDHGAAMKQVGYLPDGGILNLPIH